MYYKHITEIAPKQGWLKVYKVFYKGNNINHLKFQKKELVKEIPIQIDIPLESYEISISHFDRGGLQSDDRFFTTTSIGKRYNKSICDELCKLALGDLNTNFIKED